MTIGTEVGIQSVVLDSAATTHTLGETQQMMFNALLAEYPGVIEGTERWEHWRHAEGFYEADPQTGEWHYPYGRGGCTEFVLVMEAV